MSLMDRIKAQAKADKKRIVLPEGAEERTVKAAAILLKEGICDVILLGDEEKIAAYGEDLTGATIINPKKADCLQEYADTLYELRKAKGMTPEKALATMQDETFFGTMMMKKNAADGMVSSLDLGAQVQAWSPVRSTPPRTPCARRCRSSRPSPA